MNVSQTRTFPGQFESLAAISEFVTSAAEVTGLDARATYAVQLAVDEACSNIIEHAYRGEGRGSIQCTCHISEEELTIVLRDYGHPFDPDQVPVPNVNACLGERPCGGLGLYFMRQLMDEVHFELTPNLGNILTMVKRKESVS
jgi:serine/threonine-protein kinase RsbW